MVEKLVAKNGKLVTERSVQGAPANGTAFCICTSPGPELDNTNVVVGRVFDYPCLPLLSKTKVG